MVKWKKFLYMCCELTGAVIPMESRTTICRANRIYIIVLVLEDIDCTTKTLTVSRHGKATDYNLDNVPNGGSQWLEEERSRRLKIC